MAGIYSTGKIVPIADHDPAKFPKRLFVQNADGSLTAIESRIFYRIERDTRPDGKSVKFFPVGDNRPLFVEVE